MSGRTSIEWTQRVWNPVRGCARVSEGCRNCYAEVMAARFSGPGQWGEGLASIVRGADGRADHRWTGRVVRAPEAVRTAPLRWRAPQRVFVNSTSDLFHEDIPDAWIDEVFAVMALSPQHVFQVLTKRPERMRAYLQKLSTPTRGYDVLLAGRRVGATLGDVKDISGAVAALPLPNVWLGVSVEDQATADTRIPHLLATPAAVRFVSAEPLLGAVDLRVLQPGDPPVEIDALAGTHGVLRPHRGSSPHLDWVICGGESGPGARPMHPDWARGLRDQCAAAGTAFFFKQWGAWAPWDDDNWSLPSGVDDVEAHDRARRCEGVEFLRVGKAAAGRILDGRTHHAFPAGVVAS